MHAYRRMRYLFTFVATWGRAMFTDRLHEDRENMKEKILSYGKRILICLNVTCKIAGIVLLLIVISSRNTALLPVGAITFIISSFGCFAVVYENKSLLLTYSTLLFLFLASQITVTGLYWLELTGPKTHRHLLFEKMYTFSTAEWIIASITACVQVTAAILAVCVAKMLQVGKGEVMYRDIMDKELQDMALILPNA